MEIVELYPKIYVYKNAIKNPELLVKKIEDNANWEKWWIFGKMAKGSFPRHRWENFPSETEWNSYIDEIKKSNNATEFKNLVLELKEYFYITTKNYVSSHSVELDNWVIETPSVNMYLPNPEEQTGSVTMGFHTDWQGEKAEARGDKFKITCTMYLNDDYEGGELAFAVTEDPSNPETYKVIKYRPQAGDIVIFPSGKPYYHGVTKLISGNRYMVRTFWLENFPGTPEWLEGEAQYGEEVWAEMEKEREKLFLESELKIQDSYIDL